MPISPIPRPYNTRDTAGLTKLNPGEERTITLPVPAGVSAAVIQLTVAETGSGEHAGARTGRGPTDPTAGYGQHTSGSGSRGGQWAR